MIFDNGPGVEFKWPLLHNWTNITQPKAELLSGICFSTLTYATVQKRESPTAVIHFICGALHHISVKAVELNDK